MHTLYYPDNTNCTGVPEKGQVIRMFPNNFVWAAAKTVGVVMGCQQLSRARLVSLSLSCDFYRLSRHFVTALLSSPNDENAVVEDQTRVFSCGLAIMLSV